VLKAGSSNPAGVGSGGQFINNVGAKGIAARSGRYLVYSGAPRSTKAGMSGYSERYNTDASYTPDGTANMFLYRGDAQAGTLPGGSHAGMLPGKLQQEVPSCSSGAEPDLSESTQEGLRGQNSCGSITPPDAQSS
jgi:hypothetical protein